MKRLVLIMMLIGGAILSTQAQGRRDYDGYGRGRGHGYGHGGPRYEREYRGDDCRRGPRGGYYYEGPRYGYYRECAPVPVVYAAPCPPPPPVRVVYPRGPRVVIATGPIVVGF
ncbi:hypothetical protein SAMN05518672_103524 [Chitinophaga sp. CF118]|uniref:hypothetical protein n=1 Tax=Chitinophaga sp. CF118 TaxID=1884367 RepID=UPI0008ECE57B|nr:hypothetical protein [Chitinophaga sp. CF118]SFD85377.1 hypothetical protein SAMN05518672_103524 [Chitinophaga sp. CF118]